MVAFVDCNTKTELYPKEPKPEPHIGETVEFSGNPVIYRVTHIHRKYDNFVNGDLVIVYLEPSTDRKKFKNLKI